jgi:hypothetical protein
MDFGKGKGPEKAGNTPAQPNRGMVPSKSLPELTGKELDEAFERVLVSAQCSNKKVMFADGY